MTIFTLARMSRFRLIRLYAELAREDARYGPTLAGGMSREALAAAIADMQEHPHSGRSGS